MASDWVGRAWRSISAASLRPRTPDSRMSPRSPWATASDARVNLRRHAVLFALLLTFPAAPAGAADSRSLEVRPVAPSEALRRQQRQGEPVRAAALTAAERAVLEAR